MGFASKSQLNRHLRKYHAQVDDDMSLAAEISALKKRRLTAEKAHEITVDNDSDGRWAPLSRAGSPKFTAYLELPIRQFQTAENIVEDYDGAMPTPKDLEGVYGPTEASGRGGGDSWCGV